MDELTLLIFFWVFEMFFKLIFIISLKWLVIHNRVQLMQNNAKL